MRVIYIDIVLATNFIINYFLLLATAKICAIAARRRRIALAASIGSAYAALAVLPGFEWASHTALKLVLGAVMLISAFGIPSERRKFARSALVFFAVSAAAAGAVTAATLLGGSTMPNPVNLRLLLAAFAVFSVAATLVFRRAARPNVATVTLRIRLNGREITLRALLDSGNSLADPITGDRVCIVHVSDILPLFAPASRTILARAATLGPEGLTLLHGARIGASFRLIPFNSVGGAGTLVAFRPDYISLDDTPRRDMIVALSPHALADNATYSAIV